MSDNLPPLPISLDKFTELAHRTASRYSHRSELEKIAYTFLPHTLEDFHRQVCEVVEADRVSRDVPAGWVMLDKNGVVHRNKWKRIDFFGSIDDNGTAFTIGEIEYESREWPGLSPFTVRPVSFMAPVAKDWPMEEQPDGTVIPVDPSELIAAAPQPQPVQSSQFGSPELQSLILEKLAQPVQTQPSEAATLAIEALEAAKNGLEWYRTEYPEQVNGCDDEMDQQIEAAIAALQGKPAEQAQKEE